MTLEQLRVFIAVAELEHMTRAARELNLTQSAASSAIAALEARYATKLFDRVGRNIALTPAGRLFLSEARAVMARAKAAELVLADLAGLKVGSLSIAASQTVGNYWLPEIVQRFHSLYPGISISLTIGNTATVASLVVEGEANIGFAEGDIDQPTLTVEQVAQDELALVVASDHPWAALKDFRTLDLSTTQWVTRETGSGTRAVLSAVLSDLGIDLDRLGGALTLPSNEAVRSAVEAGAGAAVLSRRVVENSIKAGWLKALDYRLPSRRFVMVRHRARYATAVEAEFARLAGKQDLSA
ncbi:MAG: LysR substrate-binding domain-containing protein [Rhizobiaceae bacterium]|nr:LysR substrate-binding domain-containing protein [Rhizobiaceae bacterium]